MRRWYLLLVTSLLGLLFMVLPAAAQELSSPTETAIQVIGQIEQLEARQGGGLIRLRIPNGPVPVVVTSETDIRRGGTRIAFGDLALNQFIRADGERGPNGTLVARRIEVLAAPPTGTVTPPPPPPTQTVVPEPRIAFPGVISSSAASNEPGLAGVLVVRTPRQELVTVRVPTEARLVNAAGQPIPFSELTSPKAIFVVGQLVAPQVVRALEVRLGPDAPPPPPEPIVSARGEISAVLPGPDANSGALILRHLPRPDGAMLAADVSDGSEDEPRFPLTVTVSISTTIVNPEGQRVALSDLTAGQPLLVIGLRTGERTIAAHRIQLLPPRPTPTASPTPPPHHTIRWEGTITRRDDASGLWVIGGITVRVSETTQIDESAGPAQVGAWVLVRARVSPTERPPVAESIQVRRPPQPVMVRGPIERIDQENGVWSIRRISFRVLSDTIITGATPAIGRIAEATLVHGADGRLVATHITVQDRMAPPVPVGFKGVLEAIVDAQTWTVNGRTIRLTPETIVRGTPVVGARVEGRGVRNADNSITAQVVLVRSEVEQRVVVGLVAARPTGSPVGDWQVTVRTSTGTTETLTIVVTPDTTIDESRGPAAVGTIVEVRGRPDPADAARLIVDRLRVLRRP